MQSPITNVIPYKKAYDIEQAIADYDYLGKQIKALEEKRKALKDSLVVSYFNDQPEYRDCNGILLATYNEITREDVNRKLLKTELPDIFCAYRVEIKYKELRIK